MNDSPIICNRCYGFGYISITGIPCGQISNYQSKICSVCNGKGATHINGYTQKCIPCDGNGGFTLTGKSCTKNNPMFYQSCNSCNGFMYH